MAAPERDHYLGPWADDDTSAVLDEALAALGAIRLPTGWLGDGGAEVQLLGSLRAEIDRRMPAAVAFARDQEYSWAEIGDQLGTTRAAAWQRYARASQAVQKRTRRELLANDE